MLNVNALGQIFQQKPESVKETASEYVVKFTEISHEIDLISLIGEMDSSHTFDEVEFYARFDHCLLEELSICSNEQSIWRELGSRISQCVSEECDYSIEIRVRKHISDKCEYAIYCMDSFCDWFLAWPSKNILAMLNEVFSSRDINSLKCVFPNEDDAILRFRGVNKKTRDSIIEKRKTISSIDGFEQLFLVPEDLFIDQSVGIGQKTLNKVTSLCRMLSLAYVSNKSSFFDNALRCEILGRSRMVIECEFLDFDNQNQLYELYNWIYTGGEVFDKSELARNIICFHSNDSSSFSITSEDIAIIRDNYKVYLRESSKEYLSAREKLLTTVTEYCDRVTSCVIGYVGDFKKNLVAILGYTASLLLVERLNSVELDFFTGEIAQVSALILIVSCSFGIASWVIHWRQVEYYKSMIDVTCKSFQDIFKNELNALVLNNPQKIRATKYFYRWSIVMLVLWILICAIMFIFLDHISGATLLFGGINFL